MTILSTEPRVNGFHKSLDSQEPLVKPSSTKPVAQPVLDGRRERPTPSDLLTRFIQQHHELESYKCVP